MKDTTENALREEARAMVAEASHSIAAAWMGLDPKDATVREAMAALAELATVCLAEGYRRGRESAERQRP